MLPSPKNDENPDGHIRLRLAALFVIFVALVGALVGILAGNVFVPPAPPPPATPTPAANASQAVPSDWYVPPTIPPPSFSPRPSQRPRPSGSPGASATPAQATRLPSSLAVTSSSGSSYGETWSFEARVPGDYTFDPSVSCRWTMQLSDGRTVSTAGPASANFCDAWRVTVPYVPPSSGPGDFPAIVTLEMSGRDGSGASARITSSPFKAQPLDGTTSTSFIESSLPLLWLDGSPAFDADGKAQLRIHWLQVDGAIDSIASVPELKITAVTNQVYEVTNSGTAAEGSGAVITVSGHDVTKPGSALLAKFTIRQAGG